MGEAVLILVSCADCHEAARIGRALVERRLAACVHLRPHSTIYRWRGQVEEASETGLLIKTVAHRAEAAMACIRAMHSYEVPAIIVVSAASDGATAIWLEAETVQPDQGTPEGSSASDGGP